MSFLAKLFGRAAGETVKGTLEGIGGLAKDLRSAITGKMSPEDQAELQSKILEIEMQAKQGQFEINKQEAAHASVFVSGWRPAIGWMCAIGLGCYFIPQYALASVLWVKSSWAAQIIQPFPVSADGLLELVGGMLGLALIRGVEKIKGTARN